MYATLRTIFLGKQRRALRQLETDNASLIIEQKIAEAEAGHAAAKRSLAAMIVQMRANESALERLRGEIADLSDRTRKALAAGDDALAADAAAMIAPMEDERRLREDTLAASRARASRLRLALERNQRQLIGLRQGLITAQSVERERRGLAGSNGSPASERSVRASIREGEAVLARLLGSDDPGALDDALDEVEDALSGRDVVQQLAERGHGKALKTRPEDVLERLRAEVKS